MSSAIIFFSFMLMSSLTTIFGMSIQGMNINRVFNNMPLALIEDSVFIMDTKGEVEFTFDRDAVKSKVKNYLSKSLEGMVDKYEISFNYYKEVDGKLVIDGSIYATHVDIHLRCEYATFFTFNGYRSYHLERI